MRIRRIHSLELTRSVRIVAAFAAIYLIWGSTYLAIKYAIETIPPYLMTGSRFLVAGTVLYGWARQRGVERPTLANWRAAALVGGFLLLGGNGSVVWAEQHVASGLAALLVATMPLWIIVLEWVRPGGTRPSGQVAVGMVAGFMGVALLVNPGGLAGTSQVDTVGAVVLLCAALSWATGTLCAGRVRLPDSPMMAAAAEMLVGGGMLVLVGLLTGEGGRFELAAVSFRSVLSVVYLIVFGSLVGFTAYIWLLAHVIPTRVATYAYVNPIIAIFLGWALAGEPITVRTIVATAVIITAVIVINLYRAPQGREYALTGEKRVDGSLMRNSA